MRAVASGLQLFPDQSIQAGRLHVNTDPASAQCPSVTEPTRTRKMNVQANQQRTCHLCSLIGQGRSIGCPNRPPTSVMAENVEGSAFQFISTTQSLLLVHARGSKECAEPTILDRSLPKTPPKYTYDHLEDWESAIAHEVGQSFPSFQNLVDRKQ